MRRALKIGLGVIVALVVLAVVAVLIMAGTNFGLERARRVAVDVLREQINGEVDVGRIEGNLLTRFALVDVQLNDEAGRPFLTAERITGRVALGPLLRQQVVVPELTLVEPVVHLVKSSEGEWNFAQIFATTDTTPPDTTIGWGDFIDVRDIAIRDGTLIVRQPWPSQEPVARPVGDTATSGVRWRIERGPQGWQQVMEFRHIEMRAPRFVIAHPDSTVMAMRIDRVSMEAAPFQPPPLVITDLEGDLRIGEDTLELRDLDLRLPDSRLTGDLAFAL
ncbi:MAG TPA: AsmA family protein, partial [Gemmatimonadaceae bacterium]